MSAAHISDELPRMLTGEASREAVLSAAEHLRGCVDCQHELVSAVVAHASLTSAQRFAPEIVSGMFTGALTERDRTESAAEAAPDGEDGEGPTDFTLPDLSAVFAQVRKEAAEPRRASAVRHPSRTRYLIGAAAAVVLLGTGTAVYVATSGNDHTGAPSAGRTIQLAPFGSGKTPASANINGTQMSIDAASLPQLSGKRYEVWLTNDARTRMQPVGWLGANGTAAMTIPPDLMSQYRDIEVSVQQVNAKDYTFSGTSVLRGSLA